MPIPYPTIGGRKRGKAAKPAPGTKIPVPAKGATQNDLMRDLDELHGALKGMTHKDPNIWHETVDAYVVTVAAIFTTHNRG